MAEDGKKVAIIGGLAAVIGGIFLATRAKAAPPPPEGAEIIIEVLDAEGNPLPHNSPVELEEGESYTVRLTITNLSTKAGVPWDATLDVVIQAATAYTALIPVSSSSEYFAAGQTKAFNYPMNIPLGTGGETGQITALVKDPMGVELARAAESIDIITIEIIYGATVVIG